MLNNYWNRLSPCRIRETGTDVRGPRMPDSKIQTETDVDEHCLIGFAFHSAAGVRVASEDGDKRKWRVRGTNYFGMVICP